MHSVAVDLDFKLGEHSHSGPDSEVMVSALHARVDAIENE